MSMARGIFAPDAAQSLVEGFFPSDVAVAVSFPWEAPEGLWPAEQASLRKPNHKRLAEFAAGRRAARKALARLGVPAQAVPQGPDRAPVWPQGVVGSISHTDSICIVALGHAPRHAALALDLEEDADLPPEIVPEICTREEGLWLSVQPQPLRGRLARLIFSAKECAYKLQYPLTHELLDFDAFEITPDLETGQFEATLTRPVAGFGERHQFFGRFAFDAGLMLTGMRLSRRALPKME